MNITIPDIIFGAILLFFIINGYRKGLIDEIARLTSLVIGCFIAKTYYIVLIPYIEEYFINQNLIQIIAFLIIFFISVILINILCSLIQKLFEIAYLGWLNRLLGALLGFIKGIIVITIIILCMDILPKKLIIKVKEESIIYSVGNNLKENYLQLSNNINIPYNKINIEQFKGIKIHSLDSLINN